MIKVIDNITDDELVYDDIEDFREAAKHLFDDSVHDAIDALADALISGNPTGEFEAFLGIEVR